MRLLVATSDTQGWDDGDFDDGIAAGELVAPNFICDRDRDPESESPCGCSRAFFGMSSHKITTTAVVAEIPITRLQLCRLVRDANPGTNWWHGAGLARQLRDYGLEYPVGTVVGISYYRLHLRRPTDHDRSST